MYQKKKTNPSKERCMIRVSATSTQHPRRRASATDNILFMSDNTGWQRIHMVANTCTVMYNKPTPHQTCSMQGGYLSFEGWAELECSMHVRYSAKQSLLTVRKAWAIIADYQTGLGNHCLMKKDKVNIAECQKSLSNNCRLSGLSNHCWLSGLSNYIIADCQAWAIMAGCQAWAIIADCQKGKQRSNTKHAELRTVT